MKSIFLYIAFSFMVLSLAAQTEFDRIDSLIYMAEQAEYEDSLGIDKLSYWQMAFSESKGSGLFYRMEDISEALGDIFFKYQLYDEAINYYKAVFEGTPDSQDITSKRAAIYRKIGKSYSSLGEADSAYNYYKPILNYYSYPENLVILNELADVYSDNSDHEKSLRYNLRIEKLLLENKASKKELSKIANNIGYNYYRLKDYPNAIRYFDKALSIPDALKIDQESTILRNIGISYFNLDNSKEGIEVLKLALAKSVNPKDKAELSHLISKFYTSDRDYIRSILFLEQAKDFARRAKDNSLLAKIYADLAEAYNTTHDYDLAFEYFKDYSRLSDSLLFLDQLNQKRLLDNQKYIERAEKENRLLKAQQDFQELQLEKLEAEARNQRLENEALRSDSIRRSNELELIRQEVEIASAKEQNNLLEIARQKNLVQLTQKELDLAKANEENAEIEKEKQKQEFELAQQTIALQDRNAQLQKEKSENLAKANEIEQRKIRQRNIGIIAGLLGLIALLILWAYRNKKKDNDRISSAYDKLSEAQVQLKAAESKIKGLLKQQVSGAIAETLMTENTIVKQRFVSVLFLDIRDFTVFCEGKSPAEIIEYQNKVFGFMINIIERHHGVVNQLMGDGFMATFGAPSSHGNDCLNAYEAAQAILDTLKKKTSNHELTDTRIGIGVHAGNVVAGNVGYEGRKQFSITGNTVILAARLEQLNKKFGSTFVYSKEFWEALPPSVRPEAQFKRVDIKGRSEAMEVSYM